MKRHFLLKASSQNLMRSSLIVVVTSLLLTSCSKEGSFERPTDEPPAPEGGLLTKTVVKADGASDSAIATFFYDGNKKIRKINTLPVGITNEQYLETESRYYRNSAGLVERYVEFYRLWDNGAALGVDSVVVTIRNNGAQYTNAIIKGETLSGDPFQDSAVYSYNDKGQLSEYKKFTTGDDGKEFIDHHTKYTYDPKGNVGVMWIQFRDDAQSTDPPQVISMQYDDKVAALNLGTDGLLVGIYIGGFTGSSNLVKMEDPLENGTITLVYEYNSNNQPVKSIQTDLSTGDKATTTYYYQ